MAHIFCWSGFALLPFQLPHLLQSTASRFWVQFSFAGGAVDTFIILSGFAITYMLNARQQTYAQFMAGRFFRIYPVYLVCLAAGFITTYLMPFVVNSAGWHDDEYFNLYVRPVLDSALAHPMIHFVSHLTLLFGVIPEKILPGTTATLLAPAWSISLEWQYYLLAPFLAGFVRRPAGILALGVVGCGGLFYSRFWGSAFLPEKIPLFLVGIGSFYLYANAESFKNFRYRVNVYAGALAATLMLGWHWLALLVWIVVFGGVLADRNDDTEKKLSNVRRLLLSTVCQFVGKISYPLYLVHWPMIILLMAGLISWQPDISSGKALAAMLLAGLPVILFSAWLLHLWVEKPLMQIGEKFTR